MEDGEQFRYFSLLELKDLFKMDLTEAAHSSTQNHLNSLHQNQRVLSKETEGEISFLESMPEYAGVSDHDLLYSHKVEVSQDILEQANKLTQKSTASNLSCNLPRRTHKTSKKSWEGEGDISSLFAKALSIHEMQDEMSINQRADESATEQKMKFLENQLEKQRKILDDRTLMHSLQDGGEKVKLRIKEIQKEMQELRSTTQKGTLSDHEVIANTSEYSSQENIHDDTNVKPDCRTQNPKFYHPLLDENSSHHRALRDAKSKLYHKARILEKMEKEQGCGQAAQQYRREVEVLYRDYLSLKEKNT